MRWLDENEIKASDDIIFCMNKTIKILFWLMIAAILLVVIALLVPGIRVRVASRLDTLSSRLFYTVNKPEEQVFIPQGEATPQVQVVTMTPAAATLEAIATITLVPAELATPTVEVTPTATLQPTPLPASVLLDGITYVSQTGHTNYCAPANMGMALNYWGWNGDMTQLASILKPFAEDFNVMPYEMVNYVRGNTNLNIVLRYGGTQELLKRFVAAGYPVLIEKGIYHLDVSGLVSWMGHYNMVDGYDDARGMFRTQDSLIKENTWVSYPELDTQWRSFNFAFMIIYPPAQEAEVFRLLGEAYATEESAYRLAAETASTEATAMTGVNQYFAWFNRGSSLVGLQDYGGAAVAYDEAFAVYPGIAGANRPWRMLWYATGPYYAYYYAGRYQDVIDLATQTIDTARKPYLEESFYWRARAKSMIGDRDGANADLCESLQYHPQFPPTLGAMAELGLSGCP